MIRKLSVLMLVLLFGATVVFAQSNKKAEVKAPKAIFDIEQTMNNGGSFNAPAKVGNSVLIGTSWNAYFTQSSSTNQISTDPYSGLISVIKRSDKTGLGSGRIVYQLSDDGGLNWTVQSSPMNKAGFVAGRHPNMILSNPTKSTSVGDQAVVAGWAELASSWYWYQFGAEPELLSGTFYQKIDSTYYPGEEMFVNTKGDVYALVAMIDPDITTIPGETLEYSLFVSTNKGQTWTKSTVTQIKDSEWSDGSINFAKGYINKNGVGYILVQAKKTGDANYSFGYFKTTDDGATWGSMTFVNPYTIGDLNGVGGGIGLAYECDMTTDINGDLHFIGTFTDTLAAPLSNDGIYHIWGQGSTWNCKKVTAINSGLISVDAVNGLNTINETELSVNLDGTVVFMKWRDYPTATDSVSDLFGAYWKVGTTAHVSLGNLTQTATVNEKYSQLSPTLFEVSPNTFRPDVMWTQFGPDDKNAANESPFYYLGNVTFTATDVDDNAVVADNFNLSQNYPNPFNPSTSISFAIAQKGLVTLKVYNVMGQEIATLVNEVKEKGTHYVNFDASKLTSGVYIYTIQAGNFTSTKKMTLIK